MQKNTTNDLMRAMPGESRNLAKRLFYLVAVGMPLLSGDIYLVAVGMPLSGHPPHLPVRHARRQADPYVRLSLIRLLPRVERQSERKGVGDAPLLLSVSARAHYTRLPGPVSGMP